MRIRHHSAAGGAALLIAAGLGLGYAAATADGSHAAAETTHRVVTVADVPEDVAAWNCWTMGNHDCGDALTYPGEGDTVGAVLPKASDTGKVTVAWSNGVMWGTPGGIDVPTEWREAAWLDCVENADGGDASMFACDDQWQYPGERFDARTM